MDRVLKRGPSGFITRSQWVLSGYVPDRPLNDRAYWTQYLGDFGPPTAHGGFAIDDEHRMRQQMEETAEEMLAFLRNQIEVGLASWTNFLIGPPDTQQVHVVFWTKDTEPTHVYKITVRKSGQKAITVEDDLAENWDPGEVAERIEDAAMEMAARDPNAEPAAEEEEPELTLGELLGHQLHMVSTRNLQLGWNIRLGEMLAKKLGPEVAGVVIAAMEEVQDERLTEKQGAMGQPPKPAEMSAEEKADAWTRAAGPVS